MYDLQDQSLRLKSPRRTKKYHSAYGRHQAGRAAAQIPFLLSVQHTPYHLLKLYSSGGSNQLACLQEPCQTTPKHRSPEKRTCSVSFAPHTTKSYGYLKRKLALLKEGVFLFSVCRDYKRKCSSIFYKN